MVGGGVTGAARARLLFPFACPSHALPRPRARRFEEADGYYSELKDKYNVNVYDGKKKSWRADGAKWTAPGYARAQGDEGEVADLEAVMAVVNERASARRKRDYTEADRLRGQLQDMGIYVDDKERTWSTRK